MSTKFTYVGGMCMLIQRSDGYKILVDPYLRKNKDTNKTPEDFYDVDLILVTHHAGDYYGDVVEIMEHSNAKLVAPSDVAYFVKKECQVPLTSPKDDPENGRVYASAYGDTRCFGVTKTHCAQAIHLSRGKVNDVPVYGLPASFVIEVEPGVTYFHPGDTALHEGLNLLHELYHPNIMAIGVSNIKPHASREMSAREAAIACSWIGADYIIPTHYMPDTDDLDEFLQNIKYIYPRAQVFPGIGKSYLFHPSTVEELEGAENI